MSKYNVPDGHWDEPDETPDAPDDDRVRVDHHMVVKDERPEIERYNGLVWRFIFEDGQITAVDKSHYCPGPGHTDPMGFRAWADVPTEVQQAVLHNLNTGDASDVVDIDATEEVAEQSRP